MLEIKFRGYCKKLKKYVYGFYYSECGNNYIIEDRQKENILNRNIPYKVENIEPFIGLYDKNNQPIFKGDIFIDTYNNKSVIEYSICDSRETVGHGQTERYIFSGFKIDFVPDEIEIIGNGFENPELLKEISND